jgi:hypothetical protein
MSEPAHEILADWWYCGDVCCCSHPRIRKLTLPKAVFPDGTTRWAAGEILEEGPWISDGYDQSELRAQWQWMLDAARRHEAGNLAEIEREAAEYLT